MSKKWIAAIAIYLGLLAVCIVVLYAVPSVQGMLERTYVAEFGSLDVKDEVSAFIVRDERVYTADQSSSINRLIDEGQLVKAKSPVVELTPIEGDSGTAADGSFDDIIEELGKSVKSVKSGYTAEAGYVCYHVDGAEAELTTERMGELTKEDFQTLTNRKTKQVAKNRCKKGEPVFKIVKNGRWFLVYYTDRENGNRYREGTYMSMDVAGEDVRLRVYKVEELETETRVIFECKSFFDGFLEDRRMDSTVTLASAEGLILENGSIVTHDGKQGVFVKNKIGRHIFKEILIIAQNDEKCVVYSDLFLDAEGNFVETVGTYDEIIAVPSEEDLESIGVKDPKDKDKDKGENAEGDAENPDSSENTENTDTTENTDSTENQNGN